MKKFLILLLFPSCTLVSVPQSGYLQNLKSELSAIRDSAEDDSFQLAEVNTVEFRELMRESDNALVITWDNWSDNSLTEIPNLVEQAQTENIFFISSDEGIKRIKEEFAARHFNKAVYALSSTVYAGNEAPQTRTSAEKLSQQKEVVPASFPRFLYFKNGKYVGLLNP